MSQNSLHKISSPTGIILRNRTYWLVLSLLLILLLHSCGKDAHIQETTETRKQDLRVETAREVETTYSDEGKVKVRVNAPLLLRHKQKQDPYMEFPDGLEIQFYNDVLKPTSHLVADYAIKYENKQNVIIRDNIVVRTAKGERLYTDELIWNESKKRVTSDKKVTIYTESHKIQGIGFTANQEFTEYEILDVTGTYRLSKKELGIDNP